MVTDNETVVLSPYTEMHPTQPQCHQRRGAVPSDSDNETAVLSPYTETHPMQLFSPVVINLPNIPVHFQGPYEA